jgi:hypothetical protein
MTPAALAAPTRRRLISRAQLVMVVCLAALLIADLQLGMTLLGRCRLAVLADVAVVIVAALTRCQFLIATAATAATSISISVPLPTPRAKAARCSRRLRQLAGSGDSRPVHAASGWQRDRATACRWRALWLGIGGSLRYLGMTGCGRRGGWLVTRHTGSRRRQAPTPAMRQGRARRMAVAVRGADCR